MGVEFRLAFAAPLSADLFERAGTVAALKPVVDRLIGDLDQLGLKATMSFNVFEAATIDGGPAPEVVDEQEAASKPKRGRPRGSTSAPAPAPSHEQAAGPAETEAVTTEAPPAEAAGTLDLAAPATPAAPAEVGRRLPPWQRPREEGEAA